MSDMNKQLMELTRVFVRDFVALAEKDDNICAITNTGITAILSTLLPLAASHGGVRDQPDLDLKQRMVVMGNKSVCVAVEFLQETGMIEQLKLIETIHNLGRN